MRGGKGRGKHDLIIVLDFGGQYNQLIARRVRENNVYCEVHPYNLSIEKIKEMNPKGIQYLLSNLCKLHDLQHLLEQVF